VISTQHHPGVPRDQIEDVADFVLSLSGGAFDPARAARGKDIFAANCAACT
jgi:cytochrome c oxidase cbb3-type subunit 3